MDLEKTEENLEELEKEDLLKTQLKFLKSERTGEMIGFVTRVSRTQKLKGVYPDDTYKKKICLLSKELKGAVREKKLYDVELKPMHSGKGYVIVRASLKLIPATVKTKIIHKTKYQVTVTFGNKTIFFDPKDGKSQSSRTLTGVTKLLCEREEIKNREQVIEEFVRQAKLLVHRMESDGFIVPENILK